MQQISGYEFELFELMHRAKSSTRAIQPVCRVATGVANAHFRGRSKLSKPVQERVESYPIMVLAYQNRVLDTILHRPFLLS